MRTSAIAVVAALSLAPLHRAADRLPALPEDDASTFPALSEDVARALTIGYRAVASDLYWLEAIQYFGTPSNADRRFRGLSSLIDRSLAFDPDYDYIYQFAEEVLPYHDVTAHLWYNTEDAIRIGRKGMAVESPRWQIPWLLGYNLYTFRGEYAHAGQVMEEAARRPHAPPYLASLAARLLAQGDDVETAILLTRAAVANAHDGRVRDELADRLKSLELQVELSKLNDAFSAARREGRGVSRLEDLLGIAGLTAIPRDPFGGIFHCDQAHGKITSDHQDHLLRIHVHPGEPAVEPVAD